jgi:biopolymer transport protein ExbD
MSASISSKTSAEPNLTPLLDVVFQLITFFMLVINFSNDNYDQRVKLPVAGSAQPVDDKDKMDADRLVLNVDEKGHLLFNGETLTIAKATQEIKHQATLVKLNMEAAGHKFDPTKGLPTTIVLRGHRDTHCGDLLSIITACQANGFHKFALKALSES